MLYNNYKWSIIYKNFESQRKKWKVSYDQKKKKNTYIFPVVIWVLGFFF